MSLIERWGVAARTGRRLGLVWEPVITQSETLPERERVLLSVRRERRRDVPVPVRVLVRRTCERRMKKKKKKKKRGRIVLARAINTRITTNVSFQDSLFVSTTLFSYPRGPRCVRVHIFSIHRPFSPLNIISEQIC